MNVRVNMTALTTPRTHPTLSIYKCEHRTFCHNLVHYECVNTHLLVWTRSHTLYPTSGQNDQPPPASLRLCFDFRYPDCGSVRTPWRHGGVPERKRNVPHRRCIANVFFCSFVVGAPTVEGVDDPIHRNRFQRPFQRCS